MRDVPATRYSPSGQRFLAMGFVTLAWFWPGEDYVGGAVWFEVAA